MEAAESGDRRSFPSGEDGDTGWTSSPGRRAVASAGDNSTSFRSSSSSSSLSTSSSLHSDVDSDDVDGEYPVTQSEYEEIPSFRWIASPLRWWKTKKGSKARKRRSPVGARPSEGEQKGTVESSSRRLVHFHGSRTFDLEELLTAEAEVLGKGTLGCPVYKATLDGGYQLAIRRMKWVKTVKNFGAEAEKLGRIRHPNLLALAAYHWSPGDEGEKFLVLEFMPKSSALSAFLHARGPQSPLGWPTMMNIALGVTRGLHHLHTQANSIHGNLSSRNILLDHDFSPVIADYGLCKLVEEVTLLSNTSDVDGESIRHVHAPELLELNKANTMTDVYSLGVVIVELLTGKTPSDQHFKQMESSPSFEMAERVSFHEVLKLALECMEHSPYARPTVGEVLQRLEGIKSGSARDSDGIIANGMSKVTDDEGATANTSPEREERIKNFTLSSLGMEDPTSVIEVIAPSVDSCNDNSVDGLISKSPASCSLKETETPTKPSTKETTSDPSDNNNGLQPSKEDPSRNASIKRKEAKVKSGAKTGETVRCTEVDMNSEGKIICQMPSIDWAKVDVSVQLQVPTSPPLFTAEPDLIYQRYFQTLYKLGHHSPPLSSDILELQLNKMSIGLQSLGYPLDDWLKAATHLLVFVRKCEYMERHVDAVRANLEAQLEEVASELNPVKEEVARVESSVAALRQKQKEQDEAITQLEDQLELLKAQREETVGSLTTTTDVFAARENELKVLLDHKKHLDELYSMLPDLQSEMVQELPSLDEVFNSSFQEILSRVF